VIDNTEPEPEPESKPVFKGCFFPDPNFVLIGPALLRRGIAYKIKVDDFLRSHHVSLFAGEHKPFTIPSGEE